MENESQSSQSLANINAQFQVELINNGSGYLIFELKSTESAAPSFSDFVEWMYKVPGFNSVPSVVVRRRTSQHDKSQPPETCLSYLESLKISQIVTQKIATLGLNSNTLILETTTKTFDVNNNVQNIHYNIADFIAARNLKAENKSLMKDRLQQDEKARDLFKEIFNNKEDHHHVFDGQEYVIAALIHSNHSELEGPAKILWNLENLENDLNKVGDEMIFWNIDANTNHLKKLEFHQEEYNIPTIRVGTRKSMIPLQLAHENFGWLSYMHEGGCRVLYSVQSTQYINLKTALKQSFPSCFYRCDGFIREQNMFLTPEFLDDKKILYTKIIQHPGEYVLMKPGTSFFGLDLDYNVCETVLFHTKETFKAFKTNNVICYCKPTRVFIPKDGAMKEYEPTRFLEYIGGKHEDYDYFVDSTQNQLLIPVLSDRQSWINYKNNHNNSYKHRNIFGKTKRQARGNRTDDAVEM